MVALRGSDNARRLMLVLVLVAALGAPFLRAATTPPPAHAQAPLAPSGPAVAACLTGSAATVAVCAAFVAAVGVYLVYQGGYEFDETALTDMGGAVADWFDGQASSVKDQIAGWFSDGGTSLVVTDEVTGVMEAALAALASEGWGSYTSGDSNWPGTWIYNDTPPAVTYNTLVATTWADLSSGAVPGCVAGQQHNVKVRYGAPAGRVGQLKIWLYHADRTTAYAGVSSFTADARGGSAVEAEVSKATSTNCATLAAQGLSVKVELWTAANTIGNEIALWGVSLGPIRWDEQLIPSSPTTYSVLEYDVPLIASLYDVPAVPGDGAVKVRIPADTGVLVGVPGASNPYYTGTDGVYAPGAVAAGEAVVPGGATLDDTDSAPWWESLFGGVTGGLGAVVGRLNTVIGGLDVIGAAIDGMVGLLEDVLTALGALAGTLADVLDAVLGLPLALADALLDAIAAALVPTMDIPAELSAIGATTSTAAPFSFVGQVSTAYEGLFDYGSDCPAIDMPAGVLGATETFEFCMPAGGQTITYAASRVAAAVLVGVYGWWVYRRLIGG